MEIFSCTKFWYIGIERGCGVESVNWKSNETKTLLYFRDNYPVEADIAFASDITIWREDLSNSAASIKRPRTRIAISYGAGDAVPRIYSMCFIFQRSDLFGKTSPERFHCCLNFVSLDELERRFFKNNWNSTRRPAMATLYSCCTSYSSNDLT